MIKTILTTALLFTIQASFSQNIKSSFPGTTGTVKKYVVWVSPSKATHVYGLMFNFWPRDEGNSFAKFPKIYGAEINLNPIGLFSPFITLFHSISGETHKPIAENLDSINFKGFKKINGLQIGLINMEPTVINGLDINATGSFESKTNGITISAVMNKHYFVNGITIGVVGNHDTKCNGIQIGLINSCKQLKGFQFGLWNKNQKRSLPLINWCFRTK